MNKKKRMKRKKMEDCLIILSNFPKIIFPLRIFFSLTGIVFVDLFVVWELKRSKGWVKIQNKLSQVNNANHFKI